MRGHARSRILTRRGARRDGDKYEILQENYGIQEVLYESSVRGATIHTIPSLRHDLV
jgi:hypothetical protein